MLEEDKHLDIREKLLNLPKIKASENFESELLARINLEESRVPQSTTVPPKRTAGFFSKLFKQQNPYVVSGLSLAVVVLIIFGIYSLNNFNVSDNNTDSSNELLTNTNTESTPSPKEKLKTEENLTSTKVEEAPLISKRDLTSLNLNSYEEKMTTSDFVNGLGYTDSYTGTLVKKEESTEINDEIKSGFAPVTESSKTEEKVTADSPKLSAMPNVTETISREAEEISNQEDTSKEPDHSLREMNKIKKSHLDSLRKKIKKLEG